MTQAQASGKVWLDMDQEALDRAYDQTFWAPNQDMTSARRSAAAAEAFARLPHERIRYGSTPIESYDFYSCGKAGAPIVAFIHGGAWRSGDASIFAHLAEPFLANGAHVAVLDFTNIDPVDGHLEIMVAQVRAGVAQVVRNAAAHGGDGRVFVMGHSSGAHLASCVLVADWRAHGVADKPLAGALLMSGMYELEPVRRSKRSLYVKFTDALVEDLSAMRHIARIHCPVVVAHGDQESPEFMRQARDFADALKAAGKLADFLVVKGTNHFEMLESFHNPYGFVGRAAQALVRGG